VVGLALAISDLFGFDCRTVAQRRSFVQKN
jgi:hypothetical protein